MSLNPRHVIALVFGVGLLVGVGFYFYSGLPKPSETDTTLSTRHTTPDATRTSTSEAKGNKGGDALSTGSDSTPLRRRLTYVSHEYPRAFVVSEQSPTPGGPVAPFVAALWDKADHGDAYAGHLIFRAVYRCVQVQRQRNLEDTKSVTQSTLDHIETDLADCKDISAVDIERAYSALHRSAEQGDIESMRLFALVGPGNLESMQDALRDPQAVIRYREDSLRFLERAASMGSVEALDDLSDSYAAGVMVQADAQRAYAYKYALVVLSPERLAALAPMLDALSRKLTPAQIQLAQEDARKIANRCCK